MNVKYDLHIHTALSPCALDVMTPNNIYNMSKLNELKVIAITDHNSCHNTKAIIELAKDDELVVVPGMEVETREEIHLVCLFSDIDAVYKMQEKVFDHLPKLKNKVKVLGHQLVMDEEDEIIREEQRLLSFATDLSFEDVIDSVWDLGGIAIPAHIDRPSYSVISNLGLLPDNDKLGVLEVSQYGDYEAYAKQYSEQTVIQSSDSHELGFIGICKRSLEIPLKDGEKLTRQVFVNYLRRLAKFNRKEQN